MSESLQSKAWTDSAGIPLTQRLTWTDLNGETSTLPQCLTRADSAGIPVDIGEASTLPQRMTWTDSAGIPVERRLHSLIA